MISLLIGNMSDNMPTPSTPSKSGYDDILYGKCIKKMEFDDNDNDYDYDYDYAKKDNDVDYKMIDPL
jgi:hypothetical protein